jgi:hypothetical protein
MPGAHAQLTSSELDRAIEASTYLCGLEEFIDRPTWLKIETLKNDLTVEREDRQAVNVADPPDGPSKARTD